MPEFGPFEPTVAVDHVLVGRDEIPADLAVGVMIKMRVRLEGAHVRVQVFVGPRQNALALTGRLMMRPTEWRVLRALAAAGVLLAPDGGATVAFEGEEEVYRELGWDAPDTQR
jgi:hypothetical protein